MASLGGFTFDPLFESILRDTDTGWQQQPSYARKRPLGASVDHIQDLGAGSEDRSFEVMLTPARMNALKSAVRGKVVLFTDWDIPPGVRSVKVMTVNQTRDRVPTAVVDDQRKNVKVELVSR